MDRPTVDDIAAMREDGDLTDYLISLTGRTRTKPKPAPLAAVPEPGYRITHAGGWPLGTAATGPTPPPGRCSCAKCKQSVPAAPITHSHESEVA
ncbi:hypothetical protein ACFC09_36245 [Streptomyces sp. NPDC056161]|uniref:hypothetical protein n=1 Tax=Streptomyces sp. NPDC056161 TaxID=3345732 RepID=UPI0035DFDD6E